MESEELFVCSQQLTAETRHVHINSQHNRVCYFFKNHFSSTFPLKSVPLSGESIANAVTRLNSRVIMVGFLTQAGVVTGSNEGAKECLGSRKARKFLDYLSDGTF